MGVVMVVWVIHWKSLWCFTMVVGDKGYWFLGEMKKRLRGVVVPRYNRLGVKDYRSIGVDSLRP